VTIDPLTESVEAAAYKIPADAPEGDGTLAWDATTMVLARVRVGDTEGIGWTYGSAAAATDLARMRQAREIVGDGVELYVDANGGYGRKQAIRVMAAAADLDIGWFEEPVSSDDLDGLREVDVRDGRGRLPAGRRVPLRGHHRVAAYGRRRRLLRAPAVRPLRAAPARARRGGDPELPSSGVVPRPRPDLIDVFRRHPRPGGRRNSACLGPARSGPGVPGRRRREVPHVLTTIKEKAWPNRLHLSC
jgi:hypothetical protein